MRVILFMCGEGSNCSTYCNLSVTGQIPWWIIRSSLPGQVWLEMEITVYLWESIRQACCV